MNRKGLSLRCTTRQLPPLRPVVDAFVGGARINDPDNDPIVQLLLAGANDEELVPGVGCRKREAFLPRPGQTKELEFSGWSLSTCAEPATTQKLAKWAAVAAVVPMVLTPVAATAGEQASMQPQEPQWGETDRNHSKRVLANKNLRLAIERHGPEDHSHEPMDGDFLRIPGTVMTITGAIFMTIGGVVAAIATSGYGFLYPGSAFYYASYFGPFFAMGGTLMGVGIPLMISGASLDQDRQDWRDKYDAMQLRLLTAPTRGGGWSGTLQLSF